MQYISVRNGSVGVDNEEGKLFLENKNGEAKLCCSLMGFAFILFFILSR